MKANNTAAEQMSCAICDTAISPSSPTRYRHLELIREADHPAQPKRVANVQGDSTEPALNAILADLRQWAQAQLTGGPSVLDTPGAAQAVQVLDRILTK